MNKSPQWNSKNKIKKKKKKKILHEKISKNKKKSSYWESPKILTIKNLHGKNSPWKNLDKHIKNNLQNQSFKLQRRANHFLIKINSWPQVTNQRLNHDLKSYQKKKKRNSWPIVIHWQPNLNESWPWVIIRKIKIWPWVKNQ